MVVNELQKTPVFFSRRRQAFALCPHRDSNSGFSLERAGFVALRKRGNGRFSLSLFAWGYIHRFGFFSLAKSAAIDTIVS